MTRAYDDSTSRCKTCTYFEQAPTVPTGFGYCNYQSVPAWVHKHLVHRDEHRIMAAVEGLDCWLHTKRGITFPEGAVERAVMRVVRNNPLKQEESPDPTIAEVFKPLPREEAALLDPFISDSSGPTSGDSHG